MLLLLLIVPSPRPLPPLPLLLFRRTPLSLFEGDIFPSSSSLALALALALTLALALALALVFVVRGLALVAVSLSLALVSALRRSPLKVAPEALTECEEVFKNIPVVGEGGGGTKRGEEGAKGVLKGALEGVLNAC